MRLAGAAPTLRYGPTGDSAPRLRLKAAGMTERFPFCPSTRPPPPFPLVNSASPQIGPQRSRARSGEANPGRRGPIWNHPGRGERGFKKTKPGDPETQNDNILYRAISRPPRLYLGFEGADVCLEFGNVL